MRESIHNSEEHQVESTHCILNSIFPHSNLSLCLSLVMEAIQDEGHTVEM